MDYELSPTGYSCKVNGEVVGSIGWDGVRENWYADSFVSGDRRNGFATKELAAEWCAEKARQPELLNEV